MSLKLLRYVKPYENESLTSLVVRLVNANDCPLNWILDEIRNVVLSNDLVNYQFLSLKGAGGTYISREIASLIYGKKLGALKKIF